MTRWNDSQEDWPDNDGCGMQWIPLAVILLWAVVLVAYSIHWVLGW